MFKSSNLFGQYVAFLRGINVGGRHVVKMQDLKICLAEQGFVKKELKHSNSMNLSTRRLRQTTTRNPNVLAAIWEKYFAEMV